MSRQRTGACCILCLGALALLGACQDKAGAPAQGGEAIASEPAEHDTPDRVAENLLEKALKLGVATRDDYTALVESGGLDRIDNWNGVRLSQLQTEYAPDGKLKAFFGTTPKSASTIVEIREAISGACGLQDDDWVRSDVPGYMSAKAVNAHCDVLYLPADERNWAITVSLPGSQGAAAVQDVDAGAI